MPASVATSYQVAFEQSLLLAVLPWFTGQVPENYDDSVARESGTRGSPLWSLLLRTAGRRPADQWNKTKYKPLLMVIAIVPARQIIDEYSASDTLKLLIIPAPMRFSSTA